MCRDFEVKLTWNVLFKTGNTTHTASPKVTTTSAAVTTSIIPGTLLFIEIPY